MTRRVDLVQAVLHVWRDQKARTNEQRTATAIEALTAAGYLDQDARDRLRVAEVDLTEARRHAEHAVRWSHRNDDLLTKKEREVNDLRDLLARMLDRAFGAGRWPVGVDDEVWRAAIREARHSLRVDQEEPPPDPQPDTVETPAPCRTCTS